MHMIAESFISSLQTLAIHSPTVKKYLGLNGFRVILVTGPLKLILLVTKNDDTQNVDKQTYRIGIELRFCQPPFLLFYYMLLLFLVQFQP